MRAILFLVFLWTGHFTVYSQSANALSDWVLTTVPDQDSTLGYYWDQYGYSDSTLNSFIHLNNINQSSMFSAVHTGAIRTLLKGWEISTDQMYASGQEATYLGDGWFANWQLAHRMQIAGIPVKVGGSLVFQHNQLNKRLSAFSMEFDADQFFQQYRDRLNVEGCKQSFFDLPDQAQAALQRQAVLEKYQRLVRSPSFQSRRKALAQALDKQLAMRRKSLCDSLVQDSLVRAYSALKSIEKRVDSLFNAQFRRIDDLRTAMRSWEERWDHKAVELEQHARASGFAKDSLSRLVQGKWQAVLLGLRRFNIGSFRLNDNIFNALNIPLHGIAIAMQAGRYFYSFNYGVEARQESRLPEYVRNFRLLGAGRRVLLVKGGIGAPEESHLHLSFANIRTLGSDTLTTFQQMPRQCVVVTLNSRYSMLNAFFIEATAGLSNADYTAGNSTGELLKGLYGNKDKKPNTAASLRIGWESSSQQTAVSLGVQSVSPEYSTMGNLFLIPNRNAFQVEARQHFWKSRGQIKVMYQKSLPFGSSTLTPATRQDQLFGEISCQLDKRGSRIWLSSSPGYYLSTGAGAVSAGYQINQLTTGIQMVWHSSENAQWVSMAQLMNYADHSQFGDTATSTGLVYGLLTQTISSGRYTCNVLLNAGFDRKDSGAVRDVNAEVSQLIRLGKWQVTQGIQTVRRFYNTNWYAGVSAGLQLDMAKQLRIGANMTYLYSLDSQKTNQYFITTSMSWQF